MTMHEDWTDKLSDYLDGELTAADADAVAAHLRGCPACTAVLNDLKRVVARAQALEPRPPDRDLWPAVGRRIDRIAPAGRIAFTLPQLAAAAVLLIAISAGTAWQVASTRLVDRSTAASRAGAEAARPDSHASPAGVETPDSAADSVDAVPVSLADAQYDAAVADLEKALQVGRGRLDKATIDIVEHNLDIIDQAITQARDALAADPANAYLSGHLVEARRRKLDLLRRAAALAESN